MCPSPPRPMSPLFWPLPECQCRSGEYEVMPAQSSGATPARSRPLGTLNTYFSPHTTVVEFPPYVTPPRILSSPWYVSVKPFSQYCSSPALQAEHCRQESTIQPTAAMSPALNFVTALPTFVTRPTISCPGTTGYTVGITSFHSLRTWCKSEWQTPQKSISICTSCGRGSRRGMLNFANPEAALCAANAPAVKVWGFPEVVSFAVCLAASLISVFLQT